MFCFELVFSVSLEMASKWQPKNTVRILTTEEEEEEVVVSWQRMLPVRMRLRL